MTLVKLSEVLGVLESGSRPLGGAQKTNDGIPSLGGEHINSDGGFDFSNTKYIPKSFFASMTKGKIELEDILIVKDGATTGKISFVEETFPFSEAAINEHVFRIKINKNEAFPKYIFRYLQSSIGQNQVLSDFRGATVGGISREFVNKVFLPLPPLPEQKRIAAILDKADAIRRKRQEAIRLADELLRSVFLDMFGDPVSNPKGWELKQLESLVEHIESGWSPICDKPRNSDEQWAVLRLSAVTSGNYLAGENKQLPIELKPRPDLEVKKGDVLFTRKNTQDLVAACAFVYNTPPRLMLPDTIFRFLIKSLEKLLPEYLWGLLSESHFRKKVQSLATGTAGSMPNISKEKLMNLNIPLPDILLQKRFAVFVHKLNNLRSNQQNNFSQADSLFNSLVQRAFRGQL